MRPINVAETHFSARLFLGTPTATDGVDDADAPVFDIAERL